MWLNVCGCEWLVWGMIHLAALPVAIADRYIGSWLESGKDPGSCFRQATCQCSPMKLVEEMLQILKACANIGRAQHICGTHCISGREIYTEAELGLDFPGSCLYALGWAPNPQPVSSEAHKRWDCDQMGMSGSSWVLEQV